MKRLVFFVMTALVFGVSPAQAGPPFSNVEGVGGCALNPFAYIANTVGEEGNGLLGSSFVGRPQLGTWHVGLTESDINWNSIGANISFADRVELGYSHEFVDVQGLQNIDKDNLSLKVMLLKEGDFGVDLMPAVSAGAIWKNTEFDKMALRHSSGWDFYLVATKMVPGLPVPVILNAGLLSTNGFVRGVLGFGDHRDTVFFGNVETILFKKFIVGWEYEQDANVGKVFKGDDSSHATHALWEAHVAYMYDKNLAIIASGAYTGDKDSASQKAFGAGYVVSIQYAF